MMNTKERIIKNWGVVEFDSSSGNTEQYKKFAREFKKTIKEETKDDFELVKFDVGAFYVSGFLKNIAKPEKFIYFSISDVRHFRNEWHNHILIRTAENEKDYTGGPNHYTELSSFSENVSKLVR